MKPAKYFIGPYLSCFYTVFGRDSNRIWVVYDKAMTKEEAEKALKELNERA
jgi:hypothetical protein